MTITTTAFWLEGAGDWARAAGVGGALDMVGEVDDVPWAAKTQLAVQNDL